MVAGRLLWWFLSNSAMSLATACSSSSTRRWHGLLILKRQILKIVWDLFYFKHETIDYCINTVWPSYSPSPTIITSTILITFPPHSERLPRLSSGGCSGLPWVPRRGLLKHSPVMMIIIMRIERSLTVIGFIKVWVWVMRIHNVVHRAGKKIWEIE